MPEEASKVHLISGYRCSQHKNWKSADKFKKNRFFCTFWSEISEVDFEHKKQNIFFCKPRIRSSSRIRSKQYRNSQNSEYERARASSVAKITAQSQNQLFNQICERVGQHSAYLYIFLSDIKKHADNFQGLDFSCANQLLFIPQNIYS